MSEQMIMINEYMREGTQAVGAIVAVLKDGEVHVGVSKCHPLDEKKYTNDFAREIAITRALDKSVRQMNLPYRHVEQVRDFIEVRCPKYFKKNTNVSIQFVGNTPTLMKK